MGDFLGRAWDLVLKRVELEIKTRMLTEGEGRGEVGRRGR